MKIVAIGCSHTHGTMLDGKTGTTTWNRENAFGPTLAKKHGFGFYNVGLPGGSNEYIYRASIHFLNNHIQADEDYIFLVGWTSINRIEFRYNNKNSYTHETDGDFIDQKYVPFTAGTDARLFKQPLFKRLQTLTPLIFNDTKFLDEWSVQALTLQKVFENLKMKYLMFNTCQELATTKNNKKIVEGLNTRTYIDPQNEDACFLDWALNKGYKKTKCWHLMHDAHLAWADVLDAKCQSLNYY